MKTFCPHQLVRKMNQIMTFMIPLQIVTFEISLFVWVLIFRMIPLASVRCHKRDESPAHFTPIKRLEDFDLRM